MSMHLIILPVLLPLFAGLALLFAAHRSYALQRSLSFLATLLLVPLAWWLWQQASSGEISVYRLGNWAPPFGIVLVLDRLSALMLALTALLAVPVLWFACRGDDRRGPNFHALFQFQLMGINGAFLTGDLFNLFVFFEVLLIASYALLMHGQGKARAKAGLHYVVLNLAGSSLFLFGLGLMYAATGTLNMADVGRLVASDAVSSPLLLQVSAALLLIVFALKAAVLPLSFWLPGAYAAASAPVAALFAIMTKIGLYAIWRMWPLLYAVPGGALDGMVQPWLWPLALATLVFAALGVVAAGSLRALVAWLVLVSVGTLMAAITVATPQAWSAALYYLLHSTWAAAALFLLVGLIRDARGPVADRIEQGLALPPILGVLFMVLAVLLIGLPPLSGFVGKLLLMQAISSPWFWSVLLLASLLVMVAFSRAGSTLFWREEKDETPPVVTLREVAPVLVLLSMCIVMVVFAEPLQTATMQVAAQLLDAGGYVGAVLPEVTP